MNENEIINGSFLNEITNELPSSIKPMVTQLFTNCKKAMLSTMPKDEQGNYYSTKKEDGSGFDSIDIAENFAREITTGVVNFVKDYVDLQICTSVPKELI